MGSSFSPSYVAISSQAVMAVMAVMLVTCYTEFMCDAQSSLPGGSIGVASLRNQLSRHA